MPIPVVHAFGVLEPSRSKGKTRYPSVLRCSPMDGNCWHACYALLLIHACSWLCFLGCNTQVNMAQGVPGQGNWGLCHQGSHRGKEVATNLEPQ